MATQSDITTADGWFKAADTLLTFAVVNSAGAAQNMTGWALTFEVFLREGAATTALISKTLGAGEIALSNGAGTNDYATVTIAAANTANLVAGTYTYVLRRTDASNATILAYGNAAILSNRGIV